MNPSLIFLLLMILSRDMAAGNTFGATALSSYGGFWLSFAIIYTPGGFNILEESTKVDGKEGFTNAVGFWLVVSIPCSQSVLFFSFRAIEPSTL